MAYQIVDPASMTAGRGPHPAASPFDKRVGHELGVSAFEVYQVELPPGAETVRHSHLVDRVEDVYAFVRGWGWVVVDDEQVPVRPGQFAAVTVESTRQVRAGDDGLVFIALCAAPHPNEDGTPITDETVETLADEAEHGYDVDEVLRRGGGCPAMGSAAAAVESVRLDPEMKRDLLVRAAADGVSVSETIRRAVGQYLEAS